MEGRIAHYRSANSTRYPRQLIVHVEGVDKQDKATPLVGKTVRWVSPGKNKTTITGKVSAVHGNSGAVRVIFERGLPGQALGTTVTVE